MKSPQMCHSPSQTLKPTTGTVKSKPVLQRDPISRRLKATQPQDNSSKPGGAGCHPSRIDWDQSLRKHRLLHTPPKLGVLCDKVKCPDQRPHWATRPHEPLLVLRVRSKHVD